MTITIETINGKQYTVVWSGCDRRNPDWYRWVRSGDALIAVDWDEDGCLVEDNIATALPALPRHPKAEDARLLYRYMAEGIVPMATEEDFHNGCDLSNLAFIDSWRTGKGMTITHATYNGERIEVAIEG